MASLTLFDWSRRVGGEGNIDTIAELLSQANEIFKDALWKESNLPTGHKYTLRTGLPTGTWRTANSGTGYTKSTTAQLEDGFGVLTAWSQIDKHIAELNGDVAGARLSEDSAHMEGLSQQMAQAMVYGNTATVQGQFTGLAPRYSNIAALANGATYQNSQNILNAGGSTSASQTSIWMVGWGDETVFGIFPKGSRAGLVFEDRGDVVPAYDANNNPYLAYTSYFEWKAGLVVRDWRYAVRIANIDTTTATNGLQGAVPPDLFALLARAVTRFPTFTKRVSGITETDAPDEPSPGINAAIYANRTSREFLDIQAIRDKNVLLTPKEYAGEPVVEFRGVPIRVVDAILNTEAVIS